MKLIYLSRTDLLEMNLTLPGGRFDYGISSFINNENSVNFTSFFGRSVKLWGGDEKEFQSLDSKNTVVSESDYIARLAFQNARNFRKFERRKH